MTLADNARFWTAVLLGALLTWLAADTRAGAQTPQRPNVLLITTDQQRVDAMSFAGNRWAKTPHMDSIAANGVYFTQSYCPYPLCSPSRASLHTSRMPHEIGVDHNNMSINPSMKISGEVFRAAGYDTGYAGKWHLPEAYPADGIAGFEVLNKTTRQGKLAHDVDAATMQAAIGFLERSRDKPFYLVASFINPHDICLLAGEDSPLSPDVWKKYAPPEGAELPPLPANFAPSEGAAAALLAKRDLHAGWDETHWRRYRYAYYRMVEDVDAQIGQLLDALRRTGHEDNTLVVFTSDHGEGLGSHRWTGKMMYYEEEAAVPLIVSWKGVTPGGRLDRTQLVSALDVLPTICDYAHIAPPPYAQGRSLRPVIERPDEPGRAYVVAEMAGAAGRSFMVRSRQYKYMAFPRQGGAPAEMLFDLAADPGEMRNLAGNAQLKGELEQHREYLAEWNKVTAEASNPVKPAPKAAKAQRRKARQ